MNNSNVISQKARWIYRFDNYKRAYLLLREGIEAMQERELTQLEKEGMIQRFEYTWELAWKTLKDYLEFEGVILDKVTPASVLRGAFEAKIIQDGEAWMNALDSRNKMAHTYDLKTFEKVIQDVHDHYLKLFDDLHFFLMEEAIKGQDNA
jgi:nucleotidyltransferase substrate binding protein (TIGR01987 family)